MLRDRLGLTGTHYGCGEGQCGACTVLVDGKAVRSCRMPALQAAGKRITTVEGLSRAGRLHPVQDAFLKEQAFQCGYCTPGMIVSAVGLLAGSPDPGEEEISRALAGNVCRCGTYLRVAAAVRRAAAAMKKERS